MALSSTTKRVLNTLGKFEPALSANRNQGKAILLGDLVDSAITGGDFKAALKAAVTTVTSPNATDLPTSQTLANELKTKFNALVTVLNS